LAASTFNATLAIAGWNLRNVAFDPMFQHVIHAGIGLAERGLSMCCGYGRTDGATATAVDLTGQHQPDLQLGSQEIEERLARIEANLRLSADELRRLGRSVSGDGPVTEDTGLGMAMTSCRLPVPNPPRCPTAIRVPRRVRTPVGWTDKPYPHLFDAMP